MIDLRTGDALEVLSTMPTGSIHAVVTDPPYGVGLNKATCAWDVWPGKRIWEECRRVLIPSGFLVWSIAPHIAHERIGDVLSAGFKVVEVGFWVYGNGRPLNVHRIKRHYDLVYFMATKNRRLYPQQALLLHRSSTITGRKGTLISHTGMSRQFQNGIKRNFEYGQTDYFPANVACEDGCEAFGESGYDLIFAVKRHAQINSREETHPTTKPVDLIAQQIKLVSRPGETILDPFMGSGTAGIAAKMLGRSFIGIDLNPKYVDMAERKISNTQAPLPYEEHP